ncbi:MAG: hypothetical protein HC788_04475 [Sphingopyxis sp.]|nr:hypothetical protein [Sphingopyxis sp.]
MLIAALAAVAVMLTTKPELIPLLVHGSMAFFGLLSSGFARLTDKAELKRELRLMREQAGLGPNLGQDGNMPDQTGQTIAPQTSENLHE